MVFVGIIDDNRDIVDEISRFFLELDNYSLLFICRSFEDYKSLPVMKRNRADIIIMDAGPQNFDRLWQARYLQQANMKTQVVLLSETVDTDYVQAKLKEAGVDHIINKETIANDLAKAFGELLGRSHNGPDDRPLANGHKKTMQNGIKIPLTNREFEVIELVVKGHTNKKIGELMYISPYTVNAHLRKIYIKLSVSSRTELISRVINDLV